MKVVHIITRLILGGAQENTLLTCAGLHRRGHQVTLITGPALGPEGQLFDHAARQPYRLVKINSLRRAINPFYDFLAYYKIKKLLGQLDPDVVHTHSAKAGILGRWAADAIRNQTSDACCGTLAKLRQAQMCRTARPHIVHTIHGLAFHPYQAAWRNRFYLAIERAAAKRTDAFISVAQAMTDQALAVGIGRPEQYTKIFSGLETARYLNPPAENAIDQTRRQLNIPPQAIVITSVARLTHLKGHQYIIESAKKLAPAFPDAVWLFVGDGRLRQKLETKIKQAKLADRFRLTGLVPPEKIAGLLHASDIVVHCSLREGLARALPQALLCARPVISFDVDGAREVVVNDRTGFLIAPKDLPGLIAAQQKLLRDANLRRRLGHAGRQFCRSRFDHEEMVNRIVRLYESLLIAAKFS